MGNSSCHSCHKSKAPLNCGICGQSICKSCTQFLEDEQIEFLRPVPIEASKSTYCASCFSEKVQPILESYQQTFAKAQEVNVYFKKQGKETRLVKREEKPVAIADCSDYDRAILGMAFQAASLDCNALVDVEMKSQKVQNGSYQHLIWSGTGMPAHMSAQQTVKDRSLWKNPN